MTEPAVAFEPVEECFYCRRAAGLEEEPLGGYVYSDEHFRVGHAQIEIAGPGTLVVESRRHVLDLATMSLEEIVALMTLLPRLHKILHEELGAQRVYLVSSEAFAPHFHAWLYPWRSSEVQRGVAFLAQSRSCTADEARAAAAIVSRRLLASP